jgi:hypothetical protein
MQVAEGFLRVQAVVAVVLVQQPQAEALMVGLEDS